MIPSGQQGFRAKSVDTDRLSSTFVRSPSTPFGRTLMKKGASVPERFPVQYLENAGGYSRELTVAVWRGPYAEAERIGVVREGSNSIQI